MEYSVLNREHFALFQGIPLFGVPLTSYSYFLYVFSFFASLSRNLWQENKMLDKRSVLWFNRCCQL